MATTTEQIAFTLNEWASKLIREYGADACGVYEYDRDDDTYLDKDDLNKELTTYQGQPDEKGKTFQVIVEGITRRYFTIRIRYTKL